MEIVFHFPRKKTPRNYRQYEWNYNIRKVSRPGNEKTL